MSNFFQNIKTDQKKIKELRKAVITFYIVGIAGMLIPFTNPIFVKLTPLALLLSFALLIIFDNITKKKIIIYAIIYVLGFGVEVLGVNTGVIFGEYYYGKGLGIKVLGTPLLIGINWLFLVYVTTSILEKLKIHNNLKVVIASMIMISYDLILEQIAPKIDMWSWKNDAVPLQNYLAWFALALIFNALFKIFKIKTENKFSAILLICQTVFLTSLLFL